jgi:hypothetical protein
MFIYPIYNHNWRNISTIYIYNKTSIKQNILTIKQNTPGSRSGWGLISTPVCLHSRTSISLVIILVIFHQIKCYQWLLAIACNLPNVWWGSELLEKTAGSIIQTADDCVRLMENYDQTVKITILCHLGSKHLLVLLSQRVAVRNILTKQGRGTLFILIFVSWELDWPLKLGWSLSNDQCGSVTWLDLLSSSLGIYLSQIRNKFWSGYDCCNTSWRLVI